MTGQQELMLKLTLALIRDCLYDYDSDSQAWACVEIDMVLVIEQHCEESCRCGNEECDLIKFAMIRSCCTILYPSYIPYPGGAFPSTIQANCIP